MPTPLGSSPSGSSPSGSTSVDVDAAELYAVARLHEDLGYWDDACAWYERALLASHSRPLRIRVATSLAALCKRAGRPERAVELWRRLIAADQVTSVPYVELAKHYEHRARDYATAITIVEQALTRVELDALRRAPGLGAERAELERRLARLLDKQRRATGAPASSRLVGSARRAPRARQPSD